MLRVNAISKSGSTSPSIVSGRLATFGRSSPRTAEWLGPVRPERVEGWLRRAHRLLKWPLAILLLISALALAVPTGATLAATPTQAAQAGYFGKVLSITGDHPRAVAGETDIILETAKGAVQLTATFDTVVRIPGMEQPTLEDVSAGDTVAVLASNGRVVSILVKPQQPVRVRHFTGAVTAVDEEGAVTLIGSGGRQISAMALADLTDLNPGDLVTAVLEQDVATGSMLATGLDRALANLDRIQAAMENAEKSNAAGAAATLQVWRVRLSENSTRHLTLLQEVTGKAPSSLRPELQRRLESAQAAYATGMSRFGAGRPAAQVSGLVTSIDPDRRRVTVQPAEQNPVSLVVTAGTDIRFQGAAVAFRQLDLAHRVNARYDLETLAAIRIQVVRETLDDASAQTLLATEDQGAITGTVITINPRPYGKTTITVRDPATGNTVSLNLTNRSVILSVGRRSSLSDALLDTEVSAIFDRDSLELIELDTLAAEPRQPLLSGVVHASVAKSLPDNLTILTRGGELRTFTRTADTVIRRNGRQVSVNEIRLGDIVRPNTRYEAGGSAPVKTAQTAGTASPVLLLLSLKSPPLASIQGVIRGVSSSPQGDIRITVSTNKLDVVILSIDSDTKLTRRGEAIDAGALAVGQRVSGGSYDPISGRAADLQLLPSVIAQVNGEITEVDRQRGAVTITNRRGEAFRLILSRSDPPTINRGSQRSLGQGDLEAGQKVRVALFNATTGQLLRLTLG